MYVATTCIYGVDGVLHAILYRGTNKIYHMLMQLLLYVYDDQQYRYDTIHGIPHTFVAKRKKRKKNITAKRTMKMD